MTLLASSPSWLPRAFGPVSELLNPQSRAQARLPVPALPSRHTWALKPLLALGPFLSFSPTPAPDLLQPPSPSHHLLLCPDPSVGIPWLSHMTCGIHLSVSPSFETKSFLDISCSPGPGHWRWKCEQTAFNPLSPGLPFPGFPYLMSWLYLARRSERHGAPVLI